MVGVKWTDYGARSFGLFGEGLSLRFHAQGDYGASIGGLFWECLRRHFHQREDYGGRNGEIGKCKVLDAQRLTM